VVRGVSPTTSGRSIAVTSSTVIRGMNVADGWFFGFAV